MWWYVCLIGSTVQLNAVKWNFSSFRKLIVTQEFNSHLTSPDSTELVFSLYRVSDSLSRISPSRTSEYLVTKSQSLNTGYIESSLVPPPLPTVLLTQKVYQPLSRKFCHFSFFASCNFWSWFPEFNSAGGIYVGCRCFTLPFLADISVMTNIQTVLKSVR